LLCLPTCRASGFVQFPPRVSTSADWYKHASRHNAPEVAPVVGALLLWNYEIKGLSDRLACAVAEDVLGGLVPIANNALAVRRNDRVRAGRERGLRDGLSAS